MSISSINLNAPPPRSAAPTVQANPAKPRDPDHDGDVDKVSTAALGDVDKGSGGNILNITA